MSGGLLGAAIVGGMGGALDQIGTEEINERNRVAADEREQARQEARIKLSHKLGMEGREYTAGENRKLAEDQRKWRAEDQAGAEAREKEEYARRKEEESDTYKKRRAAEKDDQIVYDEDGRAYDGHGKARMVREPDTQYEGGDEQALDDPEFGVDEGLLSGMKKEGKEKQLRKPVDEKKDYIPANVESARKMLSSLLEAEGNYPLLQDPSTKEGAEHQKLKAFYQSIVDGYHGRPKESPKSEDDREIYIKVNGKVIKTTVREAREKHGWMGNK